MTQRTAACSCGQLAVTVDGEPVRISVCHCFACQRRTGSAFGVQARFPEGNARIDGESTTYVRVADSGNRLTYHFCPVCGATVYYTLGQAPGLVSIPVGGFADPAFPAPMFSIYESRKHPWVEVTADVEHRD